jgi:hypothetical protein
MTGFIELHPNHVGYICSHLTLPDIFNPNKTLVNDNDNDYMLIVN